MSTQVQNSCFVNGQIYLYSIVYKPLCTHLEAVVVRSFPDDVTPVPQLRITYLNIFSYLVLTWSRVLLNIICQFTRGNTSFVGPSLGINVGPVVVHLLACQPSNLDGLYLFIFVFKPKLIRKNCRLRRDSNRVEDHLTTTTIPSILFVTLA